MGRHVESIKRKENLQIFRGSLVKTNLKERDHLKIRGVWEKAVLKWILKNGIEGSGMK
jgi:hypothetical protein